jgi:hypothetical protein
MIALHDGTRRRHGRIPDMYVSDREYGRAWLNFEGKIWWHCLIMSLLIPSERCENRSRGGDKTRSPQCDKVLWRARLVALIILKVVFVASTLLSVTYSFAQERCEYPSLVGSLLTAPENQAGEFRISLDPPDYYDRSSTQRHLAYSSVWGKVLSADLAAHTGGRCNAVISRSLFPDLRVYLSVSRDRGIGDARSLACDHILGNILLQSQHDDRVILRSASDEESWLVHAGSTSKGGRAEAQRILDAALPQIYEPDSVMHSLVSLGADIFASLDGNSFRTWVDTQRATQKIRLSPLRMCDPTSMPDRLLENSRLPESRIMPPGAIELSPGKGRTGFHIRRALIVGGHGTVANAPIKGPGTDKYCDQEHAFAFGEDAAGTGPSTILIRCLHASLYGDAWTVFFCSPPGCASDRTMELALAMIGSDPDVRALATGNGKYVQPKGPYLVRLEQ